MPPTGMAFLASTRVSVPVSLAPKFENKKRYAHSRHQICQTCSRKTVITAQVGEPNKAKERLKRLWEAAAPDPVKEFPWKQAESLLSERLLFLGKKALKWSLVTFLVFSTLSDFLFSISANQELLIPFGLLVGCLMADFFRETLQQIFPMSERQLLSISCFFVLIKLVSAYFAVKRAFLLHVANGGLMQVMWQWRNLMEDNSNSTTNESASVL